jgi:hypothetical protein
LKRLAVNSVTLAVHFDINKTFFAKNVLTVSFKDTFPEVVGAGLWTSPILQDACGAWRNARQAPHRRPGFR